MNNIKLIISRDKSFVGAAMPYRVIVNGRELCKMKIGDTMSFELPNIQMAIRVSMVGNSMTIHSIEKEMVLFPQYCKTGVVNCKIKTKIIYLILTIGFKTMFHFI